MMNEASNACVQQAMPAVLAVAEENEKMIEAANRHLENLLCKLRGDLPTSPVNDGAEPTYGVLRNHTDCMQRQLRRLCRGIDELDNLI